LRNIENIENIEKSIAIGRKKLEEGEKKNPKLVSMNITIE